MSYIKDYQNNKIHDTSDKEELFRSHCSKIFRNNQNEADIVQDKIELVTNNITANSDSLHPLSLSNINILDPSFPPITTREHNKIIHHLKHKSPGPSGITAHELSYFPKSFKHAIIICVPRSTLSQHLSKATAHLSMVAF